MGLSFYLDIDVDTGGEKPYVLTLFDGMQTHNLRDMWIKAGVYDILYKSSGDQISKHLEKLKNGLKQMEENPEKFKKFNPPNSWGNYDNALKFLQDIIIAGEKHPKTKIATCS